MRLELADIAALLDCPPLPGAAAGYAIDSRALRPGDLFFAVPGERFDGHDFVDQALAAGACAAVVSASRPGPRRLPVPDPLLALQTLAHAVRQRWNKPVIAVTGSAGKTTTKDMIAAVLATRLRVLKTQGNFNNHLGLPLTLLRLQPEDDAAVVEMGMNRAGEIARLAQIAEPGIGVFTNVGAAHLANFESIDGIAAAKRELACAIPASGVLVLNADDPRVARFGDGLPPRRTMYSAADAAGIELRFPGRHNQSNAAAALAVARLFDIPAAAAAAALAALEPGPGRGRILHQGGVTLIDDCYNANPDAMEQMLRVLAAVPQPRRAIAVLGEMRELGPASPDLHRRLGAAAARLGLDALFAVAGDACKILEGARDAGFQADAAFFPDAAACGVHLQRYLRPGDAALFKASRAVHLEVALDAACRVIEDARRVVEDARRVL